VGESEPAQRGAELLQRFGGTLVLSELCERPDRNLEPLAALHPARVREPPEIAVGQLCRLRSSTAVEGECSAPEHREGVRLAAGEQLLGVGHPPLPPAELA
jgi:hypothetical protein